jgi:hypothetical protein
MQDGDGTMDGMETTMRLIAEEEPVAIMETGILLEEITVELLTQQVEEHLQETILVLEQEILLPETLNSQPEIQEDQGIIIPIM